MAMARIELRMHGVPGSIGLGAFGRFLDRFQALTSAVAEDQKGPEATWRITALSIGSALAEAAIDIPGDAPAFAAQIITGLSEIHDAPVIPESIPLRGLNAAIDMGKAATARATTLTLIDGGLSTTVDGITAVNAAAAKKATSVTLGGFYGKVEMLDVRKGKRFGIRDEFTRKWMPCMAANSAVFRDARENMEGRVFVGGEITENAAHQPLRIKVQTIESQPWSDEGSVARFVGSDPRAADGMTSAEWVREQRDW